MVCNWTRYSQGMTCILMADLIRPTSNTVFLPFSFSPCPLRHRFLLAPVSCLPHNSHGWLLPWWKQTLRRDCWLVKCHFNFGHRTPVAWYFIEGKYDTLVLIILSHWLASYLVPLWFTVCHLSEITESNWLDDWAVRGGWTWIIMKPQASRSWGQFPSPVEGFSSMATVHNGHNSVRLNL